MTNTRYLDAYRNLTFHTTIDCWLLQSLHLGLSWKLARCNWLRLAYTQDHNSDSRVHYKSVVALINEQATVISEFARPKSE